MKVLNNKECDVVTAALLYIDQELRRCYWNKYQEEMDSPFDNTGRLYDNGTFLARAYYWSGDNGDNFVYYKDNIHVDWYKHCGRGMYVEVPDDWTMEKLPDMLADCLESVRRDYGEKA